MSSVVIAGNTSGTVTLDAPNVAGTTVLTLPTTSGTVLTSASTTMPAGSVNQAAIGTNVAGTGPAFSAYQNTGSQSVANSTWTKVILPLEEFDTNNNFDSTTNFRFTPTVAGYYQINGSVSFDALSNAEILPAIYKNGSAYKYGVDIKATNMWIVNVSSLVYFNGSTDYVELYCFQVSGASRNMNAEGVTRIWFNGAMVRSA